MNFLTGWQMVAGGCCIHRWETVHKDAWAVSLKTKNFNRKLLTIL